MKIRHAILTGLAALVASTSTPKFVETSQAQTAEQPQTELKLGGDFQYDIGNHDISSQVSRLHAKYGGFAVDTRIQSLDSAVDNSSVTDKQAVASLSTGVGTFWGRYKNLQSSQSEVGSVGFDKTIRGQFILPLWISVDNTGKVLGNAFYATGNVSGLDYGAEYDLNNDAKDEKAAYIVLNTDNTATMVGKHFNGDLRTTFSATLDGKGVFSDLLYTPENGDFTSATTLSQQAYGTASKAGAKINADYFVIPGFPEKANYLSATANKTKEGFAVKGIIDHQGDNTAFTADIGYMNDGLGFTVRNIFDEGDITQELFATKRFDKMFLEAKLGDDGIDKVFASYQGDF